jgi:hypothetical protein
MDPKFYMPKTLEFSNNLEKQFSKVDICDELETTPMYAHKKLAPASSSEDNLVFNNSFFFYSI